MGGVDFFLLDDRWYPTPEKAADASTKDVRGGAAAVAQGRVLALPHRSRSSPMAPDAQREHRRGYSSYLSERIKELTDGSSRTASRRALPLRRQAPCGG